VVDPQPDHARGGVVTVITNFDRIVGANVRRLRTAHALTQAELARAMVDRGCAFSQATVWKIETGQRPVKLAEAVVIADAVQVPLEALTTAADGGGYDAELRALTRQVGDAYDQIKQAIAAYLHAQVRLRETAASSKAAGVLISDAMGSLVDTPPEQAVLSAVAGDRPAAPSGTRPAAGGQSHWGWGRGVPAPTVPPQGRYALPGSASLRDHLTVGLDLGHPAAPVAAPDAGRPRRASPPNPAPAQPTDPSERS
jgi:transcriptional regulator with XRE-family HTH domain